MSPSERADQRAADVTVAAHRLMLVVLAAVDLPGWALLAVLAVVLGAQFGSFLIIHSQEFGS